MLILKIFSGIYITCLISYSYGYIFDKIFRISNNFYEKVIVGFFVLGFIGVLINFFYPLDYLVNNLLLLTSVGILLNFLIKKKIDLNIFKYFFFISALSLILILYSNFQEDYPWYSLPFISLLNNEKIAFGIANVQFRFGHISILQYSSALIPNFFLNKNLLILPNLLIPSIFIVWIIHKLVFKDNKDFLLAKNFLFFVGIFFLTKFTRFEEYGNDVPAHALIFIIIYNILKIYSKNEKFKINQKFYFNKILIFSIFVVLQKIQYIMIIFLPLFLLYNNFSSNIVKNYKIILISFFIILAWCSKNFINTGCILFPNEITCFESLPWSANYPQDHAYPKKVFEASSAWSKGWPDQLNNILGHKEFTQNFNWFSTWYKNHGLLIIKKIFPFLFISIFLILFSKFKFKYSIFKNLRKKIFHLKYIFIYLILCLIFWLNIFPMFRYNVAFIISICAILFGLFLNKKVNYSKKEFKSLLVVCLVFLCIKNLLRINDSYEKRNVLPMIMSNTSHKVFESNSYKIFQPNNGGCYYVDVICSHHGHLKEIKIENYKNYKLYTYKR